MRYFFHSRSNGDQLIDRQGRVFESPRAACDHALNAMPRHLAKALQPERTYVTIEICDQQSSISVVRANIILEHRPARFDGDSSRPSLEH